MTLDDAIEEVKRIPTFDGKVWTAHDVAIARDEGHEAIAVILNAVASGQLVPKADANLAVAEALRKAASVARNACLVPPDGGNPTEDERVVCDAAGDYILALANQDHLAEGQAMRAERDRLLHFNRQLRDEIAEHQTIRDDLAAEVARLKGKAGDAAQAFMAIAHTATSIDEAHQIARAALTPKGDTP